MPGQVLKKILNGEWVDPATGRAVIVPLTLKQVAIDYNAIKRIEKIASSANLGERLLIVSDENTHQVLGKEVFSLLEASCSCEELVLPCGVLPSGVLPTEQIIQSVQKAAKEKSGIIAVGSGTINDICKYASHLNGQPYIICATAPSMNGYLSANASIVKSGYKASVAAHLPSAVIMDLKIMAAAPKRLIQSGFGDLLCRPTAQADWMMSHLVFGTPYTEAPFLMLKPIELKLHALARKLLEKDLDALHYLCESLLVSGIGMTFAKGSYPASQAEHMIAHTIDMKYGDALPHRYHGEVIAVTTVTMSALQYALTSQPEMCLRPLPSEKEKVAAYFGQELAPSCYREYKEKQCSDEMLDSLNYNLERKWPDIVNSIQKISYAAERIQELAFSVGLDVEGESLGLSHQQYKEVIAFAPYTRSRYTFLDLLLMQKK